jgi:hypothetical protein
MALIVEDSSRAVRRRSLMDYELSTALASAVRPQPPRSHSVHRHKVRHAASIVAIEDTAMHNIQMS